MINLYRLSTSEAGLEKGFIHSLGVVSPSSDYAGYTTKINQSTGGSSRSGYKTATWQWLNLTPTQAFQITAITEDALTNFSGVIYATLPLANGDQAGLSWVDVSAQVAYPDITTIQGVLNGLSLQAVSLSLNNITIINNPSTVVQ